MLKISLVLGVSTLLTACGSSNFNSIFASKTQKAALDQLLIRAQYEFDQGNNDKALELTEEALKVNPYEEKTLVLRAYTYLSKAGLDGFSLSKNLIEQSDTTKTAAAAATATENTDTTSKNLDSLAGVIGLSEADFDLMATANTVNGTKVYYPKSRTDARQAASEIIENIKLAVDTLCPIIQTGEAKNKDKDPRHECAPSPLEVQGRAQSHFAWALAHLGEAIAFYSVVLYDDKKTDAAAKALGPNIQRVSSGLDAKGDIGTFLDGLDALTKAINNIFPTDPTLAADSMLNAMFTDLKITSYAFAAMGGVPESVTKSIDDSIKNLTDKIDKVSPKTDSGATTDEAKQNAAVRNALTTAVATDLDKKIKDLSGENKTKACALYKQINSEKTPTGC